MFTGLVKTVGTIRAIDKSGDWRIEITSDLDMDAVAIGASIACSGVCLSVTDKGPDWFAVDVSRETLSKTHIGEWQEGAAVNLEPSLRLGGELGGHFVFGHVDGLAQVQGIEEVADSHKLTIKAPEGCQKYLAAKGSVALDGVSLTVNEVQDNEFTVNIIPHTWEHTTLSLLNKGDKLHFEADMLARYVEQMLDNRC